MPPSAWIGCVERVDDDAVGPRRVELGQVLGHRLAGDGQHVAVQQAGVEQVLEHDRHAADAVEVAHVELAARLHVGDVRDLGGDAVEVVELELDAGLVGDGQQVEHGVGRAAERRGDGDGVLERLLGHDLPRRDAEAEHVDDGLAGAARRRPRGGRRSPAATPSRAATCPIASAIELIVLAVNMPPHAPSPGHAVRSISPSSSSVIVPSGVGADGLEHAGDVERRAVVLARHDRAVVDEHARRGRGGPRPSASPGSILSQPARPTKPSSRSAMHDRLDRVA